MKFYKLFLTGTLTACARAGTNDPPNNDPPIANFAAYGLPGCSQNSQKNFTLVQTEESRCYVFTPPFPTNIQSAVTTTIIHGCVVFVYTDAHCTFNETILPQLPDNCFDQPSGMGSYKAVCGRRFPTPIASPSASICHG